MDGLDSIRPPPLVLRADCALFLDIDGTLIEFASSPERVIVPDALRFRLHRLSTWLEGALALVSGRATRSIDALFDPLSLPVAGLHGHELRIGQHTHRSIEAPPGMAAVIEAARALCDRHPGALIEDKGLTIALHWRNAPEAAPSLHAFAVHALDRLPGYRLQPGHCVIELLPAGRDKGSAIAALLEHPPFRGRQPVFLGDDLTDEPGFLEVNARGGTSVLVGTRADSAARYSLRNPASVHAWLALPLDEGLA